MEANFKSFFQKKKKKTICEAICTVAIKELAMLLSASGPIIVMEKLVLLEMI